MDNLQDAYVGETVVIETDSRLTYIGLLDEIGKQHLKLQDVSIYDPQALRVSQEEYLIEAMTQGAPASREELLVRQAQIVSIGRLADVVDPLKNADSEA